jgi:hypothetical protein
VVLKVKLHISENNTCTAYNLSIPWWPKLSNVNDPLFLYLKFYLHVKMCCFESEKPLLLF